MLRSLLSLALLAASPLVALAEDSLLHALVERCDLIDDEIVGKAVGREARLAALRCMAGKIGCVNYVHHDTKSAQGGNQSTAFGTTISEERARQLGGPKVAPPKGKYDTETPADFDRTIKGWIDRTKTGDAVACGEIGAATFLDAHNGKFGLTEQRMFKCFQLAGEAGVADAKYMTAVCLWYGIGVTRSRKKAQAMLRDWKAATGTTKAKRGGWTAARFAEINATTPAKPK